MGAAITVGDAIKAHLSQPDNWGDLFDDGEHAEKVQTYAELSWTLNQFLLSEHEDQKRILEDYLAETFTDEQVDRWVSDLSGATDSSEPASEGSDPEYKRPAKRLAVYMHNNHPTLKGSVRAVVQMLLMHYNPVEGMFPGHDLLAELTGYSKGTVSQACQAAVDDKLLKVRKAYQYGKGKNSPYVYDFPDSVKKAIGLQ